MATAQLVPEHSRLSGVLWFGFPALLLLASFLLETTADRRVLLRGTNLALPETCTFHRIFGIDCPGCGLTRTFVNLSAGNWLVAAERNPVGVAGYLVMIAQLPLALCHFIQRKRCGSVVWKTVVSWNQRIIVVWLFSLLGQWLIRMTL